MTAALVPVVVGASVVQAMVGATSLDDARQASFRRWFYSRLDRANGEQGISRAHSVVAFTDYQCQYCRLDVGDAEALTMSLNGKIDGPTFNVRDYPLEPECNASSAEEVHTLACEAAVAVRIAKRTVGDTQTRELQAWLYQRGLSLTTAELRGRLDELGIAALYDAGYSAVLNEVRGDVAEAVALGVRGTPTFLVSGVRLPGGALLLGAALDALEARQ